MISSPNTLLTAFYTNYENICSLPNYRIIIEDETCVQMPETGTLLVSVGHDKTELIYTAGLRNLLNLRQEMMSQMKPKGTFEYLWSFVVKHPDDEKLETMDRAIAKVQAAAEDFRRTLIDHLQNSPEKLLYEGYKVVKLKGFPEISECACSDDLNRLGRGTARNALTSRLVDAIKQSKPSGSTVVICSIGSGHCFHELHIHAHLNDYRVKWILIDKIYKELPDLKKSITTTFEVLAKTINPHTEMEIYNDDADYFDRPDSGADAILLIDIEEDIGSLKKRHSQVKSRGQECLLGVLGKSRRSLEMNQ